MIILVFKCAKCSVCNSINFQERTADVLASLMKLLTNSGATGIHYCVINVISGMTQKQKVVSTMHQREQFLTIKKKSSAKTSFLK